MMRLGMRMRYWRTKKISMHFRDEQHKREPQSDSPSAVLKHTPLSIDIIYNMNRKNARQIFGNIFSKVL